MKIEISPSDIKSEKKADGRGRVSLGTDFSDKRVTVAILEVEDDDE